MISDQGNGNEKSAGESQRIIACLPGLEDPLLPSHIGHDQRNGGQMAGAEEDADHAPEKRPQSGDDRSSDQPFVDGQKNLFRHALIPCLN